MMTSWTWTMINLEYQPTSCRRSPLHYYSSESTEIFRNNTRSLLFIFGFQFQFENENKTSEFHCFWFILDIQKEICLVKMVIQIWNIKGTICLVSTTGGTACAKSSITALSLAFAVLLDVSSEKCFLGIFCFCFFSGIVGEKMVLLIFGR